MTTSPSVARLVTVCVPQNRRRLLFVEAARRAGWDEPEVVPWRDLADEGIAISLPENALVRVDAPGEDVETARLLRGWDHDPDLHRVEGGADQHRGFVAALDRLSRLVTATPGARLLQQVDDLIDMCDKRRCHLRLSRAGVPVPLALPGPITGYASLRDQMAEHRMARVFVKPAHGSSASGVIALAVAPGRVRAVTSVDLVRDEDGRIRLYNSLRLRTYSSPDEVAAVVDALAPDGLHVERWVPKADVDGRVVDLRVLVVAGRATHVVVRSSRSPLTNLHLGNARGDTRALREAIGEPAWRAMLGVAEDAAAVFGSTLHAGVDVLASPDWQRFAVGEVNAFGDLLPRILHNGRDTYAEQLHALATGAFQPLSPTPVEH
ncbi:STM4014 family protein [Stackebrandtia endophytica]|uniref:STM4014 family protein n=1 Tax=Stackebrandtia endophytica TaxID=1496996 RepID=UPI0011548593